MQNSLKLNLSEKPADNKLLITSFREVTGIDIELDYPGVYDNFEEKTITPDLSRAIHQSDALALIEQAFQYSEHKIYKKSIKNDNSGKYIELSFISFIIANQYIKWIEDLEKETGWRIKINPASNQYELILQTLSLLNTNEIFPTKNPSIIEANKTVKIKLNLAVEIEKWENIRNKFFELTGFQLEYSL